MVVLDIGQGDAILLQDPSGGTVLIDGGAEPRVLDRALRRNGVRELTLIVVTHGDLDHVGGVIELLSAGRTSELWIPAHVDDGALLIEAVEAARRGGVTVVEVERGARLSLASMQIDVMGPVRRYAAENDGSVVLWITSGRSVFIGGDVEAVAQRDLPPVRPDIMVVPHHGSRSTDLKWLARTVGQLAILSYGENRYGHPNGEVLAVLEDAGAEVRHTYLDGDIVVGLGPTP
jgi:competence protein ComEC